MKPKCLKTVFLLALTSTLPWTSAQSQTVFVVVPTPNAHPTPQQNDLIAASASSSTDIWAVGQATIHFDGGKWTAFPAPGIHGNNTSDLLGVADISPTDAWAAGNVNIGEANPGQVIEHWNGVAWTAFPGPQFQTGEQPAIYGMAAISANDIWTVGSLLVNGATLYELYEHWDGAAWTASTGSFRGFFSGVSADAANDVWAVGCGTFSEHWDGTSWKFVSTPNRGSGPNCLNAVAALAPNDVWAVGYSTATQKPPQGQFDVPTHTLIEHWDGTSWSVISSPNVGPNSQYQSNRLLGITAVSSTDIWAFGSFFAASGSGNQITLLMHWDGTAWSLAPSPNPVVGNYPSDILSGGVAIGPGNVWIVGSEQESGHSGTLALHSANGGSE